MKSDKLVALFKECELGATERLVMVSVLMDCSKRFGKLTMLRRKPEIYELRQLWLTLLSAQQSTHLSASFQPLPSLLNQASERSTRRSRQSLELVHAAPTCIGCAWGFGVGFAQEKKKKKKKVGFFAEPLRLSCHLPSRGRGHPLAAFCMHSRVGSTTDTYRMQRRW